MSASLAGSKSPFGVPFVEVDEVESLEDHNNEHDAEDGEIACSVSDAHALIFDSPMRPVWKTGSSDSR